MTDLGHDCTELVLFDRKPVLAIGLIALLPPRHIIESIHLSLGPRYENQIHNNR